MDLKEIIEDWVNGILVAYQLDTEFFVVEVTVTGNKALTKITVLLDGDHGIDIDRCARVSRQLGHRIEEQNLIETPYVLEVSSPGLDMPLKLKRQYSKNIGRKVRVLLTDGSTKTGRLEAVEVDHILLIEEKSKPKGAAKSIPKADSPATVPVAWQNIAKTNVLVSFND